MIKHSYKTNKTKTIKTAPLSMNKIDKSKGINLDSQVDDVKKYIDYLQDEELFLQNLKLSLEKQFDDGVKIFVYWRDFLHLNILDKYKDVWALTCKGVTYHQIIETILNTEDVSKYNYEQRLFIGIFMSTTYYIEKLNKGL
jgi:hypothetical protein